MPFYNNLVPTYRNMLRATLGMIGKAEAHGEPLLDAKLAEDMFPLAHQFRFIANMPGEALARLAGAPFTSRDDNPASFAEAQQRIEETLALLDSVAADNFMDAEQTFDLALPNGMVFHLSAADYARDWALPNFYFHVSTAYAIMRMSGVALGKADVVPHMGRYIKQPA